MTWCMFIGIWSVEEPHNSPVLGDKGLVLKVCENASFYLSRKLYFSEEQFSFVYYKLLLQWFFVKYIYVQKCILSSFQSKAKHHAIAANLKKPFEFKDKPFIIQ